MLLESVDRDFSATEYTSCWSTADDGWQLAGNDFLPLCYLFWYFRVRRERVVSIVTGCQSKQSSDEVCERSKLSVYYRLKALPICHLCTRELKGLSLCIYRCKFDSGRGSSVIFRRNFHVDRWRRLRVSTKKYWLYNRVSNLWETLRANFGDVFSKQVFKVLGTTFAETNIISLFKNFFVLVWQMRAKLQIDKVFRVKYCRM